MILAIFQEVSRRRRFIIQSLSLAQERMPLKLISAQLQPALLRAQRGHIVMCFIGRGEGGKKNTLISVRCSCESVCFALFAGLTLGARLLSVDMV